MKVVVAGGHGLVGSRLSWELAERGHIVAPVSRRTGVDTLTCEGLEAALAGADVLVDVTNAPSFDEPRVTEFFQRSTQHLVDAAARADVGHHIALSVVGTQRLIESAYFRAKAVQESILGHSRQPHTLVRSTQFFEFMASIIPPDSGSGTVALPPALVQPAAAEDVAVVLADIVEEGPSEPVIEIAGPELHRLCDLVQWVMYSFQDNRSMVADAGVRYYGAVLDNDTLTPSGAARIGRTFFGDWLETYVGRGARIPKVHHPNPMDVDSNHRQMASRSGGHSSRSSAVAPGTRQFLPQ